MKERKIMVKISKIFLALAWAFFILNLTMFPFPEAQENIEGGSDKIIHFFLFGILTYLIINLFKKVKLSVLLFSIVASIVFSMVTEDLQRFIPGRFSSVYDLIAGSLGAICFGLTFFYYKSLKPKLLLHICCAGCGVYVSKVLKKDYRVRLYFSNSNIFPESEYKKRLNETKKIAKKFNIKLFYSDYNNKEWLKKIKGHETDKEKGERCEICYEERLKSTAVFAKKNKYDYFSSTLTVSPHKDAKKIIETGISLEKKYGIKFLGEDFKKKDGFKKASKFSKNLNLYRQNYCGCKFSRRD